MGIFNSNFQLYWFPLNHHSKTINPTKSEPHKIHFKSRKTIEIPSAQADVGEGTSGIYAGGRGQGEISGDEALQ